MSREKHIQLIVGHHKKEAESEYYEEPDDNLFVTKKREAILDLSFQSEGETLTLAESPRSGHTIKPKTAMAMHTWEKDHNEFKKKVETKSETEVVLFAGGQEYKPN